MMPATKTDSYNATLDLQASLKAFMEKLEKAQSRSERLEVVKSVVTKTGGNNLLHVAALHGATDILKKLVDAIEGRTDVDAVEVSIDVEAITIEEQTDSEVCMEALSAQNKEGYTPLHYAASRGSLEMCKDIILREGDHPGFFYPLIRISNNEGETPLFLAALHGHKETFYFLHRVNMKYMSPPAERTNFPWIRKDGDTILHCTISREYFDLSFQIIDMYKDQQIAASANNKGITPLHVLANRPSAFRSGTRFSWFRQVQYNNTIVEPLKKVGEEIDIHFADSTKEGYLHHVKSEKEKHVWASQIMDELIPEYYKTVTETGLDRNELVPVYHDISSSTVAKQGQQSQQGDTSETDDGEKMTPLLIAAKNGVIEMVKKILKDFPLAIHETTADRKNILLVAVESRQTHIFQELKNHHAWDNLTQAVDDKGNNVLHLAAKSAQSSWGIPGSPVQMQWEIKWYQVVKKNVPRYLISQTNKGEKAPGEIFTESHKDLVGEASKWLKNTSDSCSVVAVLVAGALFTTSNNVPGGFNEQTGEPTLLRDPKFSDVAACSIVGLVCSVVSLIMFLILRTSKQQPSDYKTALPLKLLVAWTFLYVSITYMLGSFSTSLIIQLRGRKSKTISSILQACLAIPCFMMLSVYSDLIKATLPARIPRPTHIELIKE